MLEKNITISCNHCYGEIANDNKHLDHVYFRGKICHETWNGMTKLYEWREIIHPHSDDPDKHFCSKDCLVGWLKNVIDSSAT